MEADLYRTWALLVRQGNQADRNFVAKELENRARRVDLKEEAREEAAREGT